MDGDTLSARDIRRYFGRDPGRWRATWRSGLTHRGSGEDDASEMELRRIDEGEYYSSDDDDDGELEGSGPERLSTSRNPLSSGGLSNGGLTPRVTSTGRVPS